MAYRQLALYTYIRVYTYVKNPYEKAKDVTDECVLVR